MVAKKYSIDNATKNHGGLLTGVTKGQEEKALDTAAFSASLNKIFGPIHGQFGYYVVEVTKITPATQQTLAAGHAADQADSQRQPADHRADRGRQSGQEGLAAADEVPLRLRDGRLRRLQGAQDLEHRSAGRRRSDRTTRHRAPPATTTTP